MERVGVKAFRDRATHYLNGSEAIAIERHGKIIGFYLPVMSKQDDEAREALDRLGRSVSRFLASTGMTEDELVEAVTSGLRE